MPAKWNRRTFLKSAPAAMSALAAHAQSPARPKAYTPADYPMVPKRYSEVKLSDTFWQPKVKTNAEITIPFEVQKLTESASAREFGGGVLEAAILSLQTHPDPKLQAHVDARIQALIQTPPARSNSGFEIATAWYNATGKRDLIDRSVRTADAI